ncbi:translation initiation factor eIF-1A [Candidatus Woesearchaeota archaeon]|nr:MAG: translation initiation factor eIF-1A [Candidatus Woesearchaeota archaeon]
MAKKPMSAKEEKEYEQEQIRRIRLPRPPQVLGIVDQRLGGSRLKVRCLDGKTRVCRIPGRLKKFLWLREGDVVIIEPWEFSGEEKGDVVLKYKPIQVQYLRKKGYLDKLEGLEEF